MQEHDYGAQETGMRYPSTTVGGKPHLIMEWDILNALAWKASFWEQMCRRNSGISAELRVGCGVFASLDNGVSS